jgi:asparagine synthase (glutamine-hydrolysing)
VPEIFGLFRGDGLHPSDHAGFAKLRDEFPVGESGVVNQRVGRSYAAAAIACHELDHVLFAAEPDRGRLEAWIGSRLTLDSIGPCQGDWRQSLRKADPPFAGVSIDDDVRNLRLFSDPFGLHPVYYAWDEELFVFSTKFFPLLKSGFISWDIDCRAVIDFFAYEHLTGDRTFANCVKTLPPGSVLTAKGGCLRHEVYCSPLEFKADNLTLTERSDALYDALRSAVSRAVEGARRVGVTLSGGLDSRALLSCALDVGADVRAFTFGVRESRDVLYARQMSEATGTPHVVVEADGSHLTRWLNHAVFVNGGMVSCSHCHILSLADVLQKEIDVVLDGLGGDALTGGHLSLGVLMARDAANARGGIYNKFARADSTPQARAELFDPDFLAACDYDPMETVDACLRKVSGRTPWTAFHYFDLAERQRRFIQYGPHLMRPILPVATPFFAPEVARLLLRAPALHLLEQRAYLRMQAGRAPRLARIPDSARNWPVSWPLSLRFFKKIIDFGRRKCPAPLRAPQDSPTDYGRWFRTTLSPFLRERLLDDSSAWNPIITRAAVERTLAGHETGTANHQVRLGCLLTFAEWRRQTRP